jgi:hypothetical protein
MTSIKLVLLSYAQGVSVGVCVGFGIGLLFMATHFADTLPAWFVQYSYYLALLLFIFAIGGSAYKVVKTYRQQSDS